MPPTNRIADTEADSTSASPLDLLSTSATLRELLENEGIDWRQQDELKYQIEQRKLSTIYLPCDNRAPYIFYVDATGKGHVVQGCCNSWTCQRCGHIRACHEYGHMVAGAKKLSETGHDLYFLTLTCRGKDMPLEEAQRDYLKWTKRLLDNARITAKRNGQYWSYAQVTERQERGHPHSHLMITFCPNDVVPYNKGDILKYRVGDKVIDVEARHDGLHSEWLVNACQLAGLGPMVSLSKVNSAIAVGIYAAKYFFKEAMTTQWPKNWRRVRYTNNWPKLPKYPSPLAFPLIKIQDWKRMEDLGVTVYADSEHTLNAAYSRLITCVVYND